MAAANGVGGDGAPLGGGKREPEKGGRRHGESVRPGRVRGVADGVQGDERKQEVARGKQEVAEASRALVIGHPTTLVASICPYG